MLTRNGQQIDDTLVQRQQRPGQTRETLRQLPDAGRFETGIVDEDRPALAASGDEFCGERTRGILAGEVQKGLLLEFLYNDQYLHLMVKLFRQAKKLLTPYLLTIIEEGKRNRIFVVPYPKAASNAILAIIQCYVEALYEKESTEALQDQRVLAKRLIENSLGMPEGSLHIAMWSA